MTPHAIADAAQLETLLADVEQRLSALGSALRERDVQAIDLQAGALHRALAQAVQGFGRMASSGGVPPLLRRRLADASGQVAAQRESLARATAALDRAIDVLLPRESAGLYSAQGAAERAGLGAGLQA